jgi:uncharacterized phage-like protein YoqJ
MLRVAFTGHRPEKLPNGYNGNPKLLYYINVKLLKERPSEVIVGGALGWDQLAHEAALMTSGTKITLVEPFKGFWKRWPIDSIEHYMMLKYNPNTTNIKTLDLSEEYRPWKMQKRNEWMVEHCDKVWAYWDGSDGGTANCVNYATKNGIPVINLYKEFNQ